MSENDIKYKVLIYIIYASNTRVNIYKLNIYRLEERIILLNYLILYYSEKIS